MRVINMKGTAEERCEKCGSWLEHWAKSLNKKVPDFCMVKLCPNKAEVGAHIKKYDEDDNTPYILPFCHEHNHAEGVLDVYDSAIPVVAYSLATCGK